MTSTDVRGDSEGWAGRVPTIALSWPLCRRAIRRLTLSCRIPVQLIVAYRIVCVRILFVSSQLGERWGGSPLNGSERCGV